MSTPAGDHSAAGLAPRNEGLPAPRRGLPPPLAREVLDPFAKAALEEDRGGGDLSSFHAVPERARARAHLVARSSGVLCGLALFARVFELCDPRAKVELLAEDGARIAPGQELARVEGSARALLTAERTALNFVQRLSGIATLTARYVERAAAGGAARVLDTRKTTPLLRVLEKYAVRCGGGENHRFGLFDEVMLKENHIELAGRPIPDVLRGIRRALGPRVRITCEARDEREARAGVEGGADVVLLDNLKPAELTRLVPLLREQARALGNSIEFEASGGIDLESIAAFSRTGVERISVGALTHSAPALDLALDLEPLA
ncbi:MAG: carboxylating nicotinate-nucleotide diphosphorylase [Planctomycetes bacterium]|nr:carboxylating nicotinate-nucleotide diphosphorylase [Planctomycetota bacterium]